MKQPILTVALFILIAGCQPGYLNYDEMQKYLADPKNGYIKSNEYNGFKFDLMFRPTELIIGQQIDLQNPNSSQVKELYNRYAGFYYFSLSISKDSDEALYRAPGGQQQFADLLNTLSFEMDQHVFMKNVENDTIYLTDYAFQRTFNMGGASSLLFVFEKEKLTDSKIIEFYIDEFGLGTGVQKFEFETNRLKSVPRLQELEGMNFK